MAFAASAQQYPERPIRLIIPAQPGLSARDTIPRAAGQKLAAALGQPVLIENRVGANGQAGIRAVATSPPDGYTLGVGDTMTMAVAPALGNAGFDAAATLTGVARLFTVPSLIVAGDSVPARHLKELIALAQAKPGTLTFASAGAASMSHLCAELLQALARVELAPAPAKSAADVACEPATSVLSQIRDDKLRPIAVAGPRRVRALPDVPTSKEAGLPGLEADAWAGIVAPTRTPPAVIKRLYDEIAKVVESQDIQNFMRAQGAEPALMGPAAFNAYLTTERSKWAKVIKSRN